MTKFEQIFLPFMMLSVLAIKAGNAIECYNCDSTKTEECSDIKKSTTLKPVTCKPSVIGEGVSDWLKEITRIDFYEASEVSVPMVCLKIIAKNADNKVVTFRGCQLDGNKSDVCDVLKKRANKNSITIERCQSCNEDFCNKSSSLQIINLWLLFVPLILLKALVPRA